MRIRKFAVSVTAAALMGAFGSALAQSSSGINVNGNPRDVNAGATSSTPNANPSSTDVYPSGTMNQGTMSSPSTTTESGSSALGGSAASGATGATSSGSQASQEGAGDDPESSSAQSKPEKNKAESK
jgi:hypothetical protein